MKNHAELNERFDRRSVEAAEAIQSAIITHQRDLTATEIHDILMNTLEEIPGMWGQKPCMVALINMPIDPDYEEFKSAAVDMMNGGKEGIEMAMRRAKIEPCPA